MTAAGKHLSVLNYDYTRDICIKVLSFHFVGMKTELTKEPSCHKLSFRDISWRAGDTQTDRRTGWLSDEETFLVSSSSSSHFQLCEHLLNIFIPLTSLPERLTWRFLSSQQVKNGKNNSDNNEMIVHLDSIRTFPDASPSLEFSEESVFLGRQ